jgi:uncharacterized protein YcfL
MKKSLLFVALCGLLVGCNAEPNRLEGKDRAAMEDWLKHGIPASKSPGAKTESKPSAVPTDK